MHSLSLAEAATTLTQAMVGAALFALFGFLKNHERRGDSLNVNKVAATIVVGAAIGVVAVVAHQELTKEWVVAQVLMYSGAVAIVQDAIKALRAKLGDDVSEDRQPNPRK